MALRIVHTSDWHLGHSLHGVDRAPEHQAFLDWLLGLLVRERADALLLTGDVFDTATPSARAERQLYDFLAQARLRLPQLDVVVIAGNHDSAARLEAPRALLRGLGVHVVGRLGRRPDQPLDAEQLVVPVRDDAGETAAWVLAVPYLRPTDLPPRQDYQAGVAEVYRELVAAAEERRQPGQALVATGHLTCVGAAQSADSERILPGAPRDGVTDAVFPPELAYVALGHLHRAQAVGEREGVRYAGSPIPLSFSERDYRHQAVVIELEGEQRTGVVAHEVPRRVDLLRLPAAGALPWAEVRPLLEALPAREHEESLDPPPFLEVRIALAEPLPSLRQEVEQALDGKAARLLKLTVERPERGAALADEVSGATQLDDLSPEDVFRRLHQRERDGAEPSPELVGAFLELLDEVREAEALARQAAAADEAAEALPPAPAPVTVARPRTAAALAEHERETGAQSGVGA